MKLFFGDNNEIFRLNKNQPSRAKNSRTGRQRDLIKERVAAHEREMRIRESEDKRISNLNEEIFRVNQSEMSDESKKLTVSMLNEQIHSIYMARAEREQAAIERELQRQQQELEERMRERERIAQENQLSNKTDEELDEMAERSVTRNLTLAGVRLENIGAMQRTRASLNASATRLRGEADFDARFVQQSNAKIIAHAIQNKTGVSFLFDNKSLSDDTFKGRHLQNLNAGISRLTSSINHQVGALYRDSQNLQNEQLRIYREKSRIPSQDEKNENDENENQSFDMRL